MFVPHRRHKTPRPVAGIALLLYVGDVRTSQETQDSTARCKDSFIFFKKKSWTVDFVRRCWELYRSLFYRTWPRHCSTLHRFAILHVTLQCPKASFVTLCPLTDAEPVHLYRCWSQFHKLLLHCNLHSDQTQIIVSARNFEWYLRSCRSADYSRFEYGLIVTWRRFGRTYCLHDQVRPEEIYNFFRRNVVT
jgi:hypothetical protein